MYIVFCEKTGIKLVLSDDGLKAHSRSREYESLNARPTAEELQLGMLIF